MLGIDGFRQPLLTLYAHMPDHSFNPPNLELSYMVAEYTEDVAPMLTRLPSATAMVAIRRS